MQTILLISKSIPKIMKGVEVKIDHQAKSLHLDDDSINELLEDYFHLMKLSNSSQAGSMKTTDNASIVSLRPDLEHLERVVRQRKDILQGGSPEEVFVELEKYDKVFSKSCREIQNFYYKIPKPFSSLQPQDLKRMLWFKLSNSYEYPSNEIYRGKFHFVWHPDAEEYQLMTKVPGLCALSACPFEAYAISFNHASRGVITVDIDANHFFTMDKFTPRIVGDVLTIRKENLFANRRVDPSSEFMSKDIKFVKPFLRSAITRLEKVYLAHSILYDGLRYA